MSVKPEVTFPAYLIIECGFTTKKQLCKTRKEALEIIQDVIDEEDAERLCYAAEVTFCYCYNGKLKVLEYDANESFDDSEDECL